MLATAHYLHHAMQTELSVWDQVIEDASPLVPTGISPSPPTTTTPTGQFGAVSMAPVEKLLRRQDLHRKQRRSNDFVSSSDSYFRTFHWPSCQNPCGIPHGDDLHPGQPGFQGYTVDWDSDPQRFGWGANNTMPQDLPEEFRRALLMANQCEWGVSFLKPSVEKVVMHIDPGAEVHWTIVVPRRRIQLVIPDSPGSGFPRHIASAHSVLLICSPLAGNFVLDPTAEQYGNPREHRFLTWRDYKKHYVLRKSKWNGIAVWCTATHLGLEELFGDGDGGGEKYWRDARKAAAEGVDAWLENMQAGKESLRSGMDDQRRCKLEAIKLKLAIQKKMSLVDAQPYGF